MYIKLHTSRDKLHQQILFFCLVIVAIALPTSRAALSIIQVLIFVNWLIEGHFKEKGKRFIRQQPAIYLTAIFFLYVIGLLWSQDPGHGINSVLKNKIPYLSLIFIVSSSPKLPLKKIRYLPILFVCAVFFTSVLGFYLFLSDTLRDPRELSPFIPHVHFSMMIVLAVALIPWLMQAFRPGKAMYYAAWTTALWLMVFLLIMSTLTAIISILLVSMLLTLYDLKKGKFQQHTAIMGTFSTIMLVSLIFTILYVSRPLRKEIDPGKAEMASTSQQGNKYTHHEDKAQRENGHLVFYFIVEEEVSSAWNARSALDFDGYDQSGNELKLTIYRYLSSKGLKKDREGIENLSEREIKAIERGVPNHLYLDWPNVFVRTHQTLWELQEYRRTGNPRGGSMAQRIETWKATIQAIKERPLLGWGTGGHLEAISFGLSQMDSLYRDFDLRHSHNQFLHVLVTFGPVGFIAFFGLLFLFLIRSGALRHQPYQILLVMTLVFMFGHAPLESQMPLNLFLFFSLYFGLLANDGEAASANGLKQKH